MFDAFASTSYTNVDGQHSIEINYSDSEGVEISHCEKGDNFEDIFLKTLSSIEDQAQQIQNNNIQEQFDAIDQEIATLEQEIETLRSKKNQLESPTKKNNGFSLISDLNNVLDGFFSKKLKDEDSWQQLYNIFWG